MSAPDPRPARSSGLSRDFTLFGLDLTAGLEAVSLLWARVLAGPPFTWAVRPAPVRLLRADGQVQVWRSGRPELAETTAGGASASSAGAGGTSARPYAAVEIPDDLVLRHQCAMPAMPDAQLEQAVLLELRSVSPFPVEALVCGWQLAPDARGRIQVDAALASRVHLQRVLPQAAASLGVPADQLEAWVLPEPTGAASAPSAVRRPGAAAAVARAQRPIVLRGFGEAARLHDALRQRRRGYALVGASAALLLAIALTPTVQLWLRSREAVDAFALIQARTQAAVALREKFVASSKALKALDSAVGESAAPLRVLTVLTNALPDDTYVQSVKIEGTKVSFSGLTDNSAALMSRLGETPGVRELRASQAATRQIGAAKESFGVEFRLDIPGVVPRSDASAASAASTPAGATQGRTAAAQDNSASNSAPAQVQQAQAASNNVVSAASSAASAASAAAAAAAAASTAAATAASAAAGAQPRPVYPPLASAVQAPAGSASAPATAEGAAQPAAASPLSRATIGGSARAAAPASTPAAPAPVAPAAPAASAPSR